MFLVAQNIAMFCRDIRILYGSWFVGSEQFEIGLAICYVYLLWYLLSKLWYLLSFFILFWLILKYYDFVCFIQNMTAII
jgi:hypothetical protein